jgi:hypothetical protein
LVAADAREVHAERKQIPERGAGLRRRKLEVVERRPTGCAALRSSDANDGTNLLCAESALPE